MNDVV